MAWLSKRSISSQHPNFQLTPNLHDQAYIIGRSDQQYTDMVAQIYSVVFLATPHKGSAYAQTLNNILKAVPGINSKAYVAELERNSNSLQDISEQFRNVCADLALISFHETLRTMLDPSVKRVVRVPSQNCVFVSEVTNCTRLSRKILLF